MQVILTSCGYYPPNTGTTYIMQVLLASYRYYQNHAGNTQEYQSRVIGIVGLHKTLRYPQEKIHPPSLLAVVSIVYPSWNCFFGVVSQGFYCIPQPKLVCWSSQPGFLLYTPAESGSWGGHWSARVSSVCPSQNWFIGVVSQGFYCIPQSNLVHLGVSQGFYCIPQPKLNKET